MNSTVRMTNKGTVQTKKVDWVLTNHDHDRYHNKGLWKVAVVRELARIPGDVVRSVGNTDVAPILGAEVADFLDKLLHEANVVRIIVLVYFHRYKLELGLVAR